MNPFFAVIPSAVILAPLAVLAAIFPGAAAVLSVLLKRWRAFLTVVGVNSTLAAAVAFWRPGWEPMLRVLIPVITAMGLVWAGVRYRRLVANDPTATEPPTRRTVGALIAATIVGFTILAGAVLWKGWHLLTTHPLNELATATAGLFAALGYLGYRRLLVRHPHTSPQGVGGRGTAGLSEEFVAIGVVLIATLILLPRGNQGPRIGPAIPTEQTESVDGPRLESARVLFRTADMDEVMSAPVVDANRIYFGTGKLTPFGSFGAVYCVDAETGAVAWRFDHGNTLRPAYATPAVADGLVYCGEGLHSDSGCRLYALKAGTGELAWSVPTASHTEGTPWVRGSRVYFCAGDDGLYCLEKGKMLWHFEGARQRLHVDSSPTIADGRVYAGSGYRTWAVFALNANSGTEIWRVPETLRSFGQPLVLGSRVAFGLGTGNLTDDLTREPEVGEPEEKEAAGAVLCVEGTGGKVVWRTTLPKSVHTEMAVDAYRIYVTCHDGCVYALDRKSGAVSWRRPVGTAFAAGPAVVTAFSGGASLAVYAVSQEGFAVCLDPVTGAVVWSKELSTLAGGHMDVLSTPAVVTVGPDGARRVIYVGGSVINRGTGRAEAVVFRLEDAIPGD